MDIRRCSVCKNEFDFDTSGLQGPDDVVCGEPCATKSAASRGNKVAIHDKSGAVTSTNMGPEDANLRHRW